MKCCGKHDTMYKIVHELFRLVSLFPRYISFYIAESRFPLGQCTSAHRKSMKTEAKAKVAASTYLGEDFVRFLAALAILPRLI